MPRRAETDTGPPSMSLRLPEELHDKLREYVKKNYTNKTATIVRLLRELLEKEEMK